MFWIERGSGWSGLPPDDRPLTGQWVPHSQTQSAWVLAVLFAAQGLPRVAGLAPLRVRGAGLSLLGKAQAAHLPNGFKAVPAAHQGDAQAA